MPPKSHHYNPQVYLRQFVNPAAKKELWEYDLRTGHAKKSSPKDSGCEDYYHSLELASGGRDDESIERSFQRIENQLPKLFEAIRNKQPVSVRTWSTLFLFAALQRARCPKAVHSFQKSMSEVYRKCFQIWKHSPGFDESMKEHGMNADEIRSTEFDLTAERSQVLMLMLTTFGNGNLARLFGQMKWAFLVAPPDRYFFTSDDPVCCWAPLGKRGPLDAVGPANAHIEVTFPLSRRICAFAHWESVPPRLYYTLPKEQVDAIDFRIVANSWRFVYGPTKDSQILSIVEEAAKSDAAEADSTD
jgi:hypothetical protein